MDVLGTEQIRQFLKESLEGRQFSGEFNIDIEPGTHREREVITLDPNEIEFKANLQAANKLLQIIPKVQSGIIIDSNENEKTTKICVTLTLQNDTPTFGKHVWTLDKVHYKKKDVGGVFTYFVTRINPPAGILNDFNWVVFYMSVKEFFRYSTFFAVILVYGLTELMKHLYLMVYKFLDILPRLVDSLMPLFLGIVNGITKIVGGFYLLLVMVWSGNNPPAQNFQARGFATRQLEHKRANTQSGSFSSTTKNFNRKPVDDYRGTSF